MAARKPNKKSDKKTSKRKVKVDDLAPRDDAKGGLLPAVHPTAVLGDGSVRNVSGGLLPAVQKVQKVSPTK